MLAINPKFDAIFAKINLVEMHDDIKNLRDGRRGREFELFTVYVFERAGFRVNDIAQERLIAGIDFELYPLADSFTTPIAYIQAKHVAQPISIGTVMELGGVLLPNPNVIKILITSNVVSDDAKEQAGAIIIFYLWILII